MCVCVGGGGGGELSVPWVQQLMKGRTHHSPFATLSVPDSKRYPFNACSCGLTECFPVVGWRSLGAISRPSGDVLHHKEASLISQLQRLSLIIILKIYFYVYEGGWSGGAKVLGKPRHA